MKNRSSCVLLLCALLAMVALNVYQDSVLRYQRELVQLCAPYLEDPRNPIHIP